MKKISGEICGYFSLSEIIEYIAFNALKPSKSKDVEILVGFVLLGSHMQYLPSKYEWKLGFPLKEKYLSKFKDQEYCKTIKLKELIDSKIIAESTFIDFALVEMHDGIMMSDEFFIQLKQFGDQKKQKTFEALIEFIGKYENYPPTDISLVINLKNEAMLGVNFVKLREYFKGRKFGFKEIVLLYITSETPDSKVIDSRIITIYPHFLLAPFSFTF